jgi:cytochrome c
MRVVTIALALGLMAGAASAQETGSVAAGRRVAATRCGTCHAVDLKDQSPNPKSPRFRDLGRNYPLNGLRQALITGMIVGHLDMPITKLTGPEADDLIAYLKSLQPQQSRPRRRPIQPL